MEHHRCFGWVNLHNRNMCSSKSSPASCSPACVYVLLFYIYIIIGSDQTQSHAFSLPSDTPHPIPSPLQRLLSAPVAFVVFFHGHGLCDETGADGSVSVSQSEPLACLQNHRLAESEHQWGVLTWHHQFLKNNHFPLKSMLINVRSRQMLRNVSIYIKTVSSLVKL